MYYLVFSGLYSSGFNSWFWSYLCILFVKVYFLFSYHSSYVTGNSISCIIKTTCLWSPTPSHRLLSYRTGLTERDGRTSCTGPAKGGTDVDSNNLLKVKTLSWQNHPLKEKHIWVTTRLTDSVTFKRLQLQKDPSITGILKSTENKLTMDEGGNWPLIRVSQSKIRFKVRPPKTKNRWVKWQRRVPSLWSLDKK